MQRFLLVCAGLASLLALTTAQADTPPEASTAGVNYLSAVGAEQHSSFTVKDLGPDAGPADIDRGTISYQNFTTGVHYNADVTCVNVFSGNQAKFAFRVPPGNPEADQVRAYGVTDGGEPGTNGDRLGILTFADEAYACAFVNGPFSVPANQVITAGNIQVRE